MATVNQTVADVELHDRVETILLKGITPLERRPRRAKPWPELRSAVKDYARCLSRTKVANRVHLAYGSASADEALCVAEGNLQEAHKRLLSEIRTAARHDHSHEYENCVFELPDGTVIGMEAGASADSDQYPIFMFKRTSIVRLGA